VNFEVVNLKPFACLAFPLSHLRENTLKQSYFGDELVTSFGQKQARRVHSYRYDPEKPKNEPS